jgi:hypothetical protein
MNRNNRRNTWLVRQPCWLAGQFDRAPNAIADREVAAWSEFMGRASAELWAADRRGR